MPAYYIAEHIITDPAKFEDYRGKVAPMPSMAELSHQGWQPQVSRGPSLETRTGCHYGIPGYGQSQCLV